MPYNYLLNTLSKDKWEKTGIHKRSGLAVPLFSIFSGKSTGIGEIPDLKYLVDWCKKTGMSIIQLLPLNEVGGDFAPYNAISTFALEPMYLSLSELKGIEIDSTKIAVNDLRKKYKNRRNRVDYSIKADKLSLLWKIFKENVSAVPDDMQTYLKLNEYWIKDYALYKVLSSLEIRAGMVHSPEFLKEMDTETINDLEVKYHDRINFYCWVQWQLFEQFKKIKEYSNRNGVLLMGDLPFLVSRISADVWSHPEYFNLRESAGAPPDMYFALGQNWGSPPYNWTKIENDGFKYLKERLVYAENFYNMYRIDHFIGLFRLWNISVGEDNFTSALHGRFEPQDEELWEQHGKKIIKVFLGAADMLPCAEDLGTVPACSYKTLKEFGITGIDFQRFHKKHADNYRFKLPEEYRTNSTAAVSTHDSTFFISWWNYEAGTLDAKFFEMLCRANNIKGRNFKKIKKKLFDRKNTGHRRIFWKEKINSVNKLLTVLDLKEEEALEIINSYLGSFKEKNKFLEYLHGRAKKNSRGFNGLLKQNIQRISESASIFNIQMLQEYLCLDKKLLKSINKWSYRINTPGTFGKKNWSVKLPIKLEDLESLEINKIILDINKKTGRVV